ncbi:MAG: hypothetical protein K2Y71_15295 [Xanthobacteraceae bacterium]|nr:hypothetical protein [Xanthobacteraceae bacterium]
MAFVLIVEPERPAMFDYGALWGVATIIGPLLLLSAMVYGVLVYRRRGPTSKQLTEDATRALYREGSRQERQQEAMQDLSSPPLAPDTSPHASQRPRDWREAPRARDLK